MLKAHAVSFTLPVYAVLRYWGVLVLSGCLFKSEIGKPIRMQHASRDIAECRPFTILYMDLTIDVPFCMDLTILGVRFHSPCSEGGTCTSDISDRGGQMDE